MKESSLQEWKKQISQMSIEPKEGFPMITVSAERDSQDATYEWIGLQEDQENHPIVIEWKTRPFRKSSEAHWFCFGFSCNWSNVQIDLQFIHGCLSIRKTNFSYWNIDTEPIHASKLGRQFLLCLWMLKTTCILKLNDQTINMDHFSWLTSGIEIIDAKSTNLTWKHCYKHCNCFLNKTNTWYWFHINISIWLNSMGMPMTCTKECVK